MAEDSVQLFSTKSNKRRKLAKDVDGTDTKKQLGLGAGSTCALPEVALPERATNPASTSCEAPPASTFRELGVSDWLCSVLESLGIRRPTQVQLGCIPAVLAGKDVIGTAQTGSGKTAAFALPILQQLAKDPYGIFALVLTPTRWAAADSACTCTDPPAACSALRLVFSSSASYWLLDLKRQLSCVLHVIAVAFCFSLHTCSSVQPSYPELLPHAVMLAHQSTASAASFGTMGYHISFYAALQRASPAAGGPVQSLWCRHELEGRCRNAFT